MGRVIDEMNYQGGTSDFYFACDHTMDHRSCPVCCGDDEDDKDDDAYFAHQSVENCLQNF